LKLAICILAALGLLCVSFASSCASQPAVHCTVADGLYSTRFFPVDGDGGCASTPGDVFGMTAYVVNPNNPGDGLSTLAIQSQTVGTLRLNGEAADPPIVDTSPDHAAYALGKFDSVLPGPDGVCRASQLAPAELRLGAVVVPDAGIDQDATDVKYEWSNVRVLVTPAQIGVQMTGDLRLTIDGCAASYHVVGLYPSVACAALDDAGNALADDAGNPVLDPTQCTPDNGINPNVDVTCDPVQALCVPTRSTPF
jgi:hypothetical protein